MMLIRNYLIITLYDSVVNQNICISILGGMMLNFQLFDITMSI